jgi:hypothetical protein
MSFSIDRLITSPRYCNTCNKTEHLKRSGTSHRVYYCAQSCQKKDCKAYKKLWPIAKKAIFLKHKRKYTPKSKEQYLSLANLPLDIICHITKHLTPTDVERVSFTCMQFNCKKKKLAAAILTAAPNKKIIDDKLLKIIKLYSNLKYLDLSECCNITDAGLAHLSTLPLQSLNLNWCHNITNTGLAHLSALPLQSLHVESYYI